MTLSVVSPVYNSSNTIFTLVDEITKSTQQFTDSFEIILVDDGSTDNSWKITEELCLNNPTLKGIKLQQNYGQHQAICAGLERAVGQWIIVMDCDLQDNPAEIINLFEQTKKGYKIVLAKRMNRKDAFWKRWTSFIFWKLLSVLSNTNIHPLAGNFGIYHKDVIQKFIASKNKEPYFSIAMQKFDFKRTFVEVEHSPRMNENSSYSLLKLLKHAANVLIKTCSLRFSTTSTLKHSDTYVVEKTITNFI